MNQIIINLEYHKSGKFHCKTSAHTKFSRSTVCMQNLCIHTYMHTCIHTYIHTHIHHTHIHTCIPTCIHTYIHTCIHTYIHASIHTCMYAYASYIHTYIHAYIYTYIHTYMLPWAYYAFQITYYAFEQCSKIFPIMPQLCSIMACYDLLCSISSLSSC